MRQSHITTEQVLWILVGILALGIRLLNLGTEALSDSEAKLALQALSIFPGTAHIDPFPPGSQVSYLSLTGFLFSLLGSNNFLARCLPALAGGLLCLVPYLFRHRLGSRAALLMGFGLALDPGMVAVSRLASGPMPTLSFGMLALGFLANGRMVLAGILFALALLSGPAFVQGLLILVLTLAIAWLAEKSEYLAPMREGECPATRIFPSFSTWKPGLLSAGVTLILVGTLFGRFPQGIGAWLGSLPEYLSGWVAVPDISSGRMFLALIFYQPIAVIFGVIALVRGWIKREPLAQRLSIWFLAALIVVLIYPARQVGDLVWALFPLLGLASIELSRYFEIEDQQRLVALGQAILIFLLWALFWLNLAGMSQPILDQRAYTLRLGVLLGICLLAVVTTLLLGYGWSWQAASRGLVWGVVAALGLYQFAGIWNASFTPSVQRYSIWGPMPQVGQADLFMQTIGELSSRTTGRYEYIEIASAVDTPSLRWLLRGFPNARFVPAGAVALPGQSPAIVITLATDQAPSLSSSYRGQDFIWWRYPGWEGAIPPGLPLFTAYRQFPARGEQVILWARSDLFPVSAQSQAEQPSFPPQVEFPVEAEAP